MPGIDQEAREELRLTLQVVPGWKLSPAGWRTVEGLLRSIGQAIEQGDRVSFFRDLEELDRAAPTRLARLSSDAGTEASAPPDPVVELVNSLVHAPSTGASGTP